MPIIMPGSTSINSTPPAGRPCPARNSVGEARRTWCSLHEGDQMPDGVNDKGAEYGLGKEGEEGREKEHCNHDGDPTTTRLEISVCAPAASLTAEVDMLPPVSSPPKRPLSIFVMPSTRSS